MRVVILVLLACLTLQAEPVQKDVPYVPSSRKVVEGMLDLAGVKEGDVVYDLGSGDGRIVIGAAKRGARAIGYEIDPALVAASLENARKAGVTELTEFRTGDLFEANFRDATVVTLYLFPKVNLALKPKLLRELRPGTRVVSNSFDMGDWRAERQVEVDGKILFLWTIPQH